MPETPFTFQFGRRAYDLSSRTYVMGILNVTPDSFSDGGKFLGTEAAVERGAEMAGEGADFIDVGGESTRPGSFSLPTDEELGRVIPVIEQLAGRIHVPISIDTTKAEVARRALEAGASIVNDISALLADPLMVDLVASRNASVILMHMKGTPQHMQENPTYSDVAAEVATFLRDRLAFALAKGIRQIIVDPGIGFGKKLEHNLRLLRELRSLTTLGVPILVGPSRKSFIGAILDLPVTERLEGTAAAVAVSILNGANIVRVHDVKAMKRVAKVADALKPVL